MAEKTKRKRYHVYDRRSARGAVKRLSRTNSEVMIACTGAGAGVADLVWGVPGVSPMYAGFHLPYGKSLFDSYAGYHWKEMTGQGNCCFDAALTMAHSSYFIAQKSCADKGELGKNAIGVGLTAVAVTDVHKKGGTRCFAAVRTDAGIWTVAITLQQGHLGRVGDGHVCDIVALNLALFGAGLPVIPFAADGLGLESDEIEGTILVPKPLTVPFVDADDFIDIYIDEKGVATPLGSLPADFFQRLAVFPGSYAPEHFAHDEIGMHVLRSTGRKVVYEMTVGHVSKEASVEEIIARSAQFRGRWPVIVRRGAGRFVDKSSSYRGAHFICGYDVAAQILNPDWYPEGLDAALGLLDERKVRVYVMDRRDKDGAVKTVDDLRVAEKWKHLFAGVPSTQDISSSALRHARAQNK